MPNESLPPVNIFVIAGSNVSRENEFVTEAARRAAGELNAKTEVIVLSSGDPRWAMARRVFRVEGDWLPAVEFSHHTLEELEGFRDTDSPRKREAHGEAFMGGYATFKEGPDRRLMWDMETSEQRAYEHLGYFVDAINEKGSVEGAWDDITKQQVDAFIRSVNRP